MGQRRQVSSVDTILVDQFQLIPGYPRSYRFRSTGPQVCGDVRLECASLPKIQAAFPRLGNPREPYTEAGRGFDRQIHQQTVAQQTALGQGFT